MKRALKIIAIVLLAVLLTGGALIYFFGERLRDFALNKLTEDMFIAQDSDSFDPGPALGSHFPGMRAQYQGQEVTLLNQFAGKNGTVFIASRSLDWCPYCMRQLIQLQQYKRSFDAAGIGLVAISYDAPELQQAFIDKFAITIPVVSDIDGLTFKTLGIFNRQYEPGDFEYGIPHPGMIIINPAGTVVDKLFVEAYSSRVDSGAALAFARRALKIN